MSLLKRKELAKSKTELGNKINYVHDLITQHKISQETSKDLSEKLFKPVTSKLDDLIVSNLISNTPKMRKRPKKGEVPDYGIDIEDEVEDINLGDLFDEQPVPPQQNKQLLPKPPTYEESLADILEGKKEIYVDPQYFPQYPQELPPEYDDEEVDYEIADYDLKRDILDDMGIANYEDVNYRLNQPEMTPDKTKMYLNKIIKDANFKRNQIKGYKSKVTKDYNKGAISAADRQVMNKRLDDARAALNEYIKHHNTKLKTKKGSGIKGRRRKQRGGNVIYFNNPKQLLNKLELIIGEIIAGNTSIQMRNTGVSILDTLLRMSAINKPQYNKLYKKYFKV